MNSTAPGLDRAFSALAYVMPLASALQASGPFLRFLSQQAPPAYQFFNAIFSFPPLAFLIALDNSIFGIVIFFGLFFFVVRNTDISRFIRFNVLQAILVSLMISITLLILSFLPITQGVLQPLGVALLNTLFLGGFILVVYAVAQSVMGRYAEIPTISDAVNTQMPY